MKKVGQRFCLVKEPWPSWHGVIVATQEMFDKTYYVYRFDEDSSCLMQGGMRSVEDFSYDFALLEQE